MSRIMYILDAEKQEIRSEIGQVEKVMGSSGDKRRDTGTGF
jgi:hypothetical protein